MSCSRAELARLAERRPRDHAQLAALIGPRRAERFAEAFLSVLAQSDA